jgi:chromosome segregation ATPase
MSRNGISQEQVFEAAANLALNQQPVTVQAVREALGVGSFTTITQHLRKWREETKTAAPATTLPPEVEAATSRAATSIWQVAEELMRREIQTIKQAAQYQVDEYQRLFEEALQEIARLESQIQTQTQQIADQHEQIGALRDALMQSKAHLLAQTSREKDLMNRLDEMKLDLTQARTAVEQRNENCALLRGELAALKADRIPKKRGPRNEENRPQ